jgi:outer membrane receptor protein involved in Fe transport
MSLWRLSSIIVLLAVAASQAVAQGRNYTVAQSNSPIYFQSLYRTDSTWVGPENDSVGRVRIVKFQDIRPLPAPLAQAPSATPLTTRRRKAVVFESPKSTLNLLTEFRKRRVRSAATNLIGGRESKGRVTSDAGSLLRKSASAFGVGTQRRTPIVVDPRIRGSRVGRIGMSGSYWVPARIDMDTALSKIDSRIVDNLIVIKGPYSGLYGPDFRFIDVELTKSPRFEESMTAGATSVDYQSNGERWFGRQSVSVGDQGWGLRIGYGHRTGSDYESGNGEAVAASFNSREFDAALGFDLSPDSSIEFNYLRLDQTDVEFPGQAFDLDFQTTDSYELTWVVTNQVEFDRLEVDVWHNQTRFKGNAQSPAKRRQFPFLDTLNYVGRTDVDSSSTGYRTSFSWDIDPETLLTAGTDLRLIRQQLNEISSGRLGFSVFDNANSPIPKSFSVNPGLYSELSREYNDLSVTIGGRVDMTTAELDDRPGDIASLGLATPQASLAEILGTDDFDQSFGTWALFMTGRYDLDDDWALTFGAGHAQRPPTLTELYVAESFLFLLQNGQNTATGDPGLDIERLWQLDLGVEYETEAVRLSVNGFHAWIHDYITFENMRTVFGPPNGQVEQLNLKYVNTEMATLTGFDALAEFDVNASTSFFATLSFVEGRDHSRNGNSATRQSFGSGVPSVQVSGLPRGTFSGLTTGDEESLPAILPFESRLGVRFKDPSEESNWMVELSARVVAQQDRVATSLLETPTPGFTTWDLRGSWQANETIQFVAGVENFTDKNYREHLDFRSANGIQLRQPGINFYFGTEANY